MTFPKEIDFTAWLQEREGICVPEAKIVIHSAFWHEGEDGKPDTQWPDKVTFYLGENFTNRQTIFAAMLCNACGNPYDHQWFYNRLSWAIQAQMEPNHYRYFRQRKRA